MDVITIVFGMITGFSVYLVSCFLWLVVNPVYRWQYRHIPGPAYNPIFGNLAEFRHGQSHIAQQLYKQKYGPVCKIWFGFRPVVWIGDAALGKRVCYKLLNRPSWLGDPLTSGPARLEHNKGLFSSRDDLWRLLRHAWQPAFYTESITAVAPLMVGAAAKLSNRLVALAASSGEPVDIWREIGSLTMMTVGSSAYGIDFHTIDDPTQQQPRVQPKEQQHKLIEAAKIMFAALGAASGSRWQIIALLTPPIMGLASAVRWLAHVFPDPTFKRVMASRLIVFKTCFQLVRQSREKLQEKGRGCSSPAGAGSSGGGSRRTGPVAPGSFLGLLLAATDSSTGHGLSDFQMTMQAATFTLAGYETTANTLAFALYLLATHPEAEQRVLQEIRAAAAAAPGSEGGKKWYSRDLEQRFPYLCAAVSETLRLYPPGASVARQNGRQAMHLGDYTLPPEASVFVNTYAIQRDPDIWPRAEEFVPERWLPGGEHLAPSTAAAYLPFGSGARMCIGFRFALQEIYLSLIELLGHFHFEVQWELMLPPLPASGTADGGLASSSVAGGGGGRDLKRELRVANGFTLAPAGGIWVKMVPRGSEAATMP